MRDSIFILIIFIIGILFGWGSLYMFQRAIISPKIISPMATISTIPNRIPTIIYVKVTVTPSPTPTPTDLPPFVPTDTPDGGLYGGN